MYYKAVILGASTGGPSALRNILKEIPNDFPLPIIIVQRIPAGLFAESLAEALDEASDFKVRILKEEDEIHDNEAVLIPGGLNVNFEGSKNVVKLSPGNDSENSPSISYTVKQAIAHFKGPLILSILTGICLDDNLVEETRSLIEQNGNVLVQKPDTCFIEDLPQTIIQSGVSNEIVELNQMAKNLVMLANKN